VRAAHYPRVLRISKPASTLRAMTAAEALAFLVELADLADPIALHWFRSADLHVEQKPDLTPVTEADRRIELEVREHAARRHPGLEVFGEELGGAGGGGVRLIVDPIDGTRNFVRGIPIFATLLALEQDGEIRAGLVSAPALRTRWGAARGCGAFENGRRIRVSGVRELARAQLFHGSLSGDEAGESAPRILALARATARQRGFGDFYQHVLVASGCGELAFDHGLRAWDVAPLFVLLEEAGGRITGLGGERSLEARTFATSNGWLHDQALALLRGPT
jgi:histidinol-phosphatase